MSRPLSLGAIPHRPPFLFVDEIVDVADDRIHTRKQVDGAADFFRGHYPGAPVMPGVLLCECCFQTGALLIAHRLGAPSTAQSIPVITRIQDARFKRLVRPGDSLDVAVTLDEVLDNAYFMTGRVTVAEKLALRVTFAATRVSAEHEESR